MKHLIIGLVFMMALAYVFTLFGLNVEQAWVTVCCAFIGAQHKLLVSTCKRESKIATAFTVILAVIAEAVVFIAIPLGIGGAEGVAASMAVVVLLYWLTPKNRRVNSETKTNRTIL